MVDTVVQREIPGPTTTPTPTPRRLCPTCPDTYLRTSTYTCPSSFL